MEAKYQELIDQIKSHEFSSCDFRERDVLFEIVDTLNFEEMDKLLQMGENIRQIGINYLKYLDGLKLGLTEIKLNAYGWIDLEITQRQTKIYGDYGNMVSVGTGTNGKWIYGYTYSYGGGAGGATPVSLCDEIFNTKEEAFQAGLEKLRQKMMEGLSHGDNDRINFKPEFIKKVLAAIETFKPKQQPQLSLF